jgi:5-methylcytosine-specific restriction protein A
MPNRIPRRSDRAVPRVVSVTALRHASANNLVYDAAWKRVAKARRRADGICQACLAEGRITAASDVDHVIPVHVRPDWRLEFDNTQAICRPHHRRKTQEDARRYGSSTAQRLTPSQHAARLAAQALARPPRAAPPGGVGQTWPCSSENRVPPDVRAAAQLGAGGVP